MKGTITGMILVLVLAAGLTACGSSRPSAQAVTEGAIQAVQSGALSAVQSQWGGQLLEGEALDLAEDQTAELLKLMGRQLTYEVVSAEENEAEGTAVVTVSFTNTDMTVVMADFFEAVLTDAMSYLFLPEEEQPTEEALAEKYSNTFTELLRAEDLATRTTTAEVDLVLEEDQWKLAADEEVLDAMFGGLLTAADAMGEAVSGGTEKE